MGKTIGEGITHAASHYRVFREFGEYCWRRVKPLKDHETLEQAIAEATEKARSYQYDDEAIFTVSTHRDGECLFRVSSR